MEPRLVGSSPDGRKVVVLRTGDEVRIALTRDDRIQAVVGRTERDRPGRSPACRAAGHRRGSRDASLRHPHTQGRVRSARPRSARGRSTLRTGFRELGGGLLRSRASGYAGIRCISSARHRRDSSSTASTWRRSDVQPTEVRRRLCRCSPPSRVRAPRAPTTRTGSPQNCNWAAPTPTSYITRDGSITVALVCAPRGLPVGRGLLERQRRRRLSWRPKVGSQHRRRRPRLLRIHVQGLARIGEREQHGVSPVVETATRSRAVHGQTLQESKGPPTTPCPNRPRSKWTPMRAIRISG